MLIEGLYSIIDFKTEDSKVSTTIKLNKAHEVFEGHFPGNPIMPGVCMIQIIKELTEKFVEKELFLSVCSNVKFMAIINPEKNETLEVVLDISSENDMVKVKNTTSFDDTLALKLSATFKQIV